MTCRHRLRSEDPLRLVGDPVDVVTGDVIDATVDVRLDGPFPFTFVRHYNSANASRDRGLGWGHAHSFEQALRFTYDAEVAYTGPSGNDVAFPILARDGESVTQSGHRLERKTSTWYRVHLPGEDEVLEFELRRPDWPAHLVGVSHPAGSIRLFYDGATGRLSAFADSLGRTIRVDWADIPDPYGRSQAAPHIVALVLSDPSSKATDQYIISYQYDAYGRLLSGTDSYRNVFSFEYDDHTRMRRLTDRRGYSFFFVYDDRGRCVHTSGEDGVEGVRLEYLEGSTIVTLADGGTWLYQHAGGFLDRIIDPYGGERRRELGDDNLLSQETDALGRTFSIVRDETGNAVGRRDSAGEIWRLDEEGPQAPQHYVPTTAREWEYGKLLPPGYGLPTRRHLELEWLPSFVINALTPPPSDDPFGNILERWKERTVRDSHGLRLRLERAGTSARRTWHYDSNGFWTRFTDFDGATWQRSFGSWNHLREVVDPMGGVTSLEHSKREQLARVTDPDGTTSAYTYDLKNRLGEVWRHGTVRETYSYDSEGELVTKVDSLGQTLLRYEREDEGRRVVRTLAGGERHEMLYTASRQLKSATIVTSDGKRDEFAFAYNFTGERVRDERNRRGVRRCFQGEKLGELSVLEHFTTRYTWADDKRLDIVDPTGAKHVIQRCHGGVIRKTTSNRITEITHFHPYGYCLVKMAVFAGGMWKRTYERTDEGDVRWIEDNIRGYRSFTYDAAHRLIGDAPPGAEHRTFTLSRGGDVLQGPGLSRATFNEHRLHEANGNRFEYDHRNHIAAIHAPHGTVHLRRDARDQLVIMYGPGIGTWSARYDVLGRRTEVTHNGKTTRWYWDTDRVAAEIDPDERLRIYVYADDVALSPFMFVDYEGKDAKPETGKRYFILNNHLGAPEAVQDDAGAMVWSAWYEAYGLAHVERGTEFFQPLRWPGHYFDAATGLHYNRFRYYSPALGRYLESDPDGIRGGLNVYAYADGNPVRLVDVRGLGCGDGDAKPNKEEDRPDKESAKAKGLEAPDAVGKPAPPKTREKLEQARAAQKRAEADAQGLPKALSNKVTASNGHKTISGHTGTVEGFNRNGTDGASMLSYSQGQMKPPHQSPAQGGMDSYGSGKDRKTMPGAAAATHAEKQLAVQQMNDGTNQPMGVSKEQCGDCRSWMQKHAQDRGEPVVLADPARTRVFNPDGSVQVYDTNHNLVQSVPPNQPPSATLTNYEGIPW